MGDLRASNRYVQRSRAVTRRSPANRRGQALRASRPVERVINAIMVTALAVLAVTMLRHIPPTGFATSEAPADEFLAGSDEPVPAVGR